ncbi:MAG: hypothetical protein V1733_02720, partial [bacterium]
MNRLNPWKFAWILVCFPILLPAQIVINQSDMPSPGDTIRMSMANLAAPRGNNEFFPGLPVNQYYIFYKNSNAAFVDVGFAFKIQGVPIPARYDTPDKQYQFPLDTNATWASVSSVSFGVPGMFYFSTHRTRSSFVDGWGTVITLQAIASGGAPPYQFIWSTFDTTPSITVTMESTRIFAVVVVDALNNFGSDQKTVTVVSPGID